ncbi:MAG: GNAT family N-acetyltransferase [Burkholderiales bacterium]|nr:GNAT family N-acetyltransferase [Burkholderiales bacterium]
MSRLAAFEVRLVAWDEAHAALESVRRAVFVVEQNVPEELEWDEADAVSQHALASSGGMPVGTARLLPDGHIGRIAVLRDWRGQGVGGALLTAMIDVAAKRGFATVLLNAQVQALDFYRRFGFVAEGEVFDDAGIPHRAMRLDITPPVRSVSPG